jgi:hypothetical protein
MIKVVLVGGGYEVRPSRQPGLQGDLLVGALGVFQWHLEVDLVMFPSRQVRRECGQGPENALPVGCREAGAEAQTLIQSPSLVVLGSALGCASLVSSA